MQHTGQTKQNVTLMVLKALVPYSRQNLKLSFKPRQFFNDLEIQTKSTRNSLSSTLSRAKRDGLVENINGVPVLTKTGLEKIGQLKKTELLSGWLLVAFDIPEKRRKDRDYLRNYLKTNDFIILQKSIWYTNLDKTEELKEVIVDLNLGSHVCIFMAAHVFAPGLSSSN